MAVVSLDGRLLSANSALCALLCRSAEELVESSLADVILSDDGPTTLESGQRTLARRDDGLVPVLVTRTLILGWHRDPLQYLMQFEETTSEEAMGHDLLTDLPDRRLFLDHLGLALRRAQRWGSLVSVLVFNLGRLQDVHDALGPRVGEHLLVAVGNRLRASLRGSDTVARLGGESLGGDRFAVLCEDITGEQHAVRLAERLLKMVAMPFALGTHEVQVTASIGVKLVSADHRGPAAALFDAESAATRAEDAGDSRYELFDEAVRARAVQRLHMESGLRGSLDRGELRLHYQPTVHLESGTFVGAEALVRWQHPQRGLIAPADFIPLAEETGLIVPIGAWVLNEACGQAARWRQRFNRLTLTVSVNLSPAS